MQPDQTKSIAYDLFLIGDTGNINRQSADPVMETLKAHLDPAKTSGVLFLGDNIYPRGLPREGHILRADAEKALNMHFEALKDYHGKVLFISGNHDWNKGRKDGYEYILRQEKYLEKLFEQNVMLPSHGCPGPSEVKINERLTLVLINTQWWLQPGFRPIGQPCGCRVDSEEAFYETLKRILDKNKGKRIVIAGHAPVYSYAIHGGRYKFRHHVFPLTIYHKKAWLPLPFVGSLLPMYRKFFGAKEDIAHPRYRHLRKQLTDIFKQYDGLVYAAGHEHNLQHIERDGNHYVVSGAGSKLKYVLQQGKNLRFGMKAKGFFKLSMNEEGELTLSAWITDKKVPEGVMMYEQRLG